LSIPETEDLRAKARRLARQRKANRAFAEKRRLARAAAVQSGKAVFLSPTEYCIATGLHPATVYRARRMEADAAVADMAPHGHCRGRSEGAAMIRIAITQATYDAIAATFPVGKHRLRAEVTANSDYLAGLDERSVERLGRCGERPRATSMSSCGWD
jgi:hypothetical protein